MPKRSGGRKKGGHNRGFFFRKGRGWFAIDGKRMVPLLDKKGERITSPNAGQDDIRDAYAWWRTGKAEPVTSQAEPACTVTVLEVCQAYLANAKAVGAAKTHFDRADTLFDFCFGIPPKFRNKDGSKPRPLSDEEKKEIANHRIHAGYGGTLVCELRPIDVDMWLNVHKSWGLGGRRSRIQAVKRALNYGVESGLIPKNPIRGYRAPRSTARITYITPEQEQALLKHARAELRLAIKVCIRTGARFGSEFCVLTRQHVVDHGDKMEWKFKAHEVKTRRDRTIRITDPEIMDSVRERMKRFRSGPLFRNSHDKPWQPRNLSHRFSAVRNKLIKKGVEFDADCCMYSCRHTYAKRTLQGYWTGKATNIETLARLMGNSPQVCREHYLQWSDIDNDPLWDAA
jgi:Phage integrase family